MEYDEQLMEEIVRVVGAYDPLTFVVFFWMAACVFVFMFGGDE
jgi:hypothetical protein